MINKMLRVIISGGPTLFFGFSTKVLLLSSEENKSTKYFFLKMYLSLL